MEPDQPPTRELLLPSGSRRHKVSAAAMRETLGFIGVVASLIFVGMEIRQNTAVARGQARHDLAALNQEWLILQTADSVFNDLYRRAWIEPDDLTPSEAA